MSKLTTHVLDLSLGAPATRVTVLLERRGGSSGWQRLVETSTDDDGRATLIDAEPAPDVYRLTFETGAYFGTRGVECFHPSVSVVFTVTDGGRHHHVPLLLSPFGYSTYRGS